MYFVLFILYINDSAGTQVYNLNDILHSEA